MEGIFNKSFYACFSGEAAIKFKKIDDVFRGWVCEENAQEYFIPALIDGDVLEKCGYFKTMPHQLSVLTHIDNSSSGCQSNLRADEIKRGTVNKYLTPAACLHIYPTLQGKNNIENTVITTKARVYRYENGEFETLTRLWDFTVRELVFVGDEKFVSEKLDSYKEKVMAFSKSIGLECEEKIASDYFYPSKENILKQRIQKSNKLKYEHVVEVNGKDCAITSFNYHATHFSKIFDFDNGNTIVTGCIGFGLERWIAALMAYNIDLSKIR